MNQLVFSFIEASKEDLVFERTLGSFWTPEALKEQLLKSNRWLLDGLIKLATTTKRYVGRDNIGFNKFDREIGMNIYQYYKQGKMTEKQLEQLRRIVPKYAKQLTIAANDKLKKQIH